MEQSHGSGLDQSARASKSSSQPSKVGGRADRLDGIAPAAADTLAAWLRRAARKKDAAGAA
jgi:hypothetical protein